MYNEMVRIMKNLKINHFYALLIVALLINGCADRQDPVTGETKTYEPDPQKRAKEFAEKGGGIFGDFNNKRAGANIYEFATSNVLWRATLKSLDFLPILNADYSGGIVIYDWYSEDLDSKEQIKVSVRFLSNEVRSDSIDVSVYKRICESLDKCKTIKLKNNFPSELKDNILSVARLMKVEEAKKEKK
jgi:hypothetical protein